MRQINKKYRLKTRVSPRNKISVEDMLERSVIARHSVKSGLYKRSAGFRRPMSVIVSVGPSVSGKERPYKVILEKEAVYEEPSYLV